MYNYLFFYVMFAFFSLIYIRTYIVYLSIYWKIKHEILNLTSEFLHFMNVVLMFDYCTKLTKQITNCAACFNRETYNCTTY